MLADISKEGFIISISMLLSSSLINSFIFMTTLVQAFPGADHQYQAPKATDLRNPCPAINVIDNHGFIDRTGKNIPVNKMNEQLSKVFDVHIGLNQILSGQAAAAGLTETVDGIQVMDINSLYEHNKLEHDSSFVRTDAFFGESKSLFPDSRLMKVLFESNDSDRITRDDLAAFQRMRIHDTRRHNDKASFTDGAIFSMAAQATLIMAFAQRSEYDYILKSRLRPYLEEERLPDGYAPLSMDNSTDFEAVGFGEGSKSAAVLSEFQEKIKSAIAEELPPLPPPSEDTCHSPRPMFPQECK